MAKMASLYERIGGTEAVDAMVLDFYSRIFTDRLLKPFFAHTDVDKLMNMQKELFTAALDGPLEYTGRPLSEAHFGRGITRKHFERFVNHALATLRERGLEEKEINGVIGRLNLYVGDVSGIYGSAG